MDTPITRAEFDAYKEVCEVEHGRLSDENSRQNHRIDALEDKTGKILELATSVHSLADSVERMLNELENHSKRIGNLENRDGEKWRKAVGYVAAAIAGGLVTFLLKKLGL